jgi:hypothetical protein
MFWKNFSSFSFFFSVTAKPNAEGATRNPYSQELTPDDLADLESMRQVRQQN